MRMKSNLDKLFSLSLLVLLASTLLRYVSWTVHSWVFSLALLFVVIVIFLIIRKEVLCKRKNSLAELIVMFVVSLFALGCLIWVIVSQKMFFPSKHGSFTVLRLEDPLFFTFILIDLIIFNLMMLYSSVRAFVNR